MTNQQLRDWVLDPVRTNTELHAVAAHYGLPHAGMTRHQVVVALVTHLGTLTPGDPATYTFPPAPVGMVANPFVLRSITLLVAVQVVADFIGLGVSLAPLAAEFQRIVLTVVLGLTLVWDIALIVGLFMGLGLMSERRRRNGIYWGTIASAFTLVALLMLWVNLGLAATVVTASVVVLIVLVAISDIAVSINLLKRT